MCDDITLTKANTRHDPACHRPATASRAVASLAAFSSACRSAKVSADILKLTSCAEFVRMALSAAGPDAPPWARLLDSKPAKGGGQACLRCVSLLLGHAEPELDRVCTHVARVLVHLPRARPLGDTRFGH